MAVSEKTELRRLLDRLRARGVDVEPLTDLAVEYVATRRRLARLRTEERGAVGYGTKEAAGRNIRLLQIELRRLHNSLWAPARRGVPASPPPTAEAVATVAALAEADRHWRACIWGEPGRTAAEINAQWAALKARWGPPNWNALLEASLEEQLEAEAEIRRFNRQHRQQSNRS